MSTSSRLRILHGLAVVPVVAALLAAALAVTGAACSDDGGDPQTDAKPLPGSQPTLERWIVTFAGDGPDLAAYKAAAKDDPAAVAAAVASLREQQKKSHADFAATVDSVGGKVVDWWWMSNAATVEVDPSGLPTIKKMEGVKSVVPDRLLDE